MSRLLLLCVAAMHQCSPDLAVSHTATCEQQDSMCASAWARHVLQGAGMLD